MIKHSRTGSVVLSVVLAIWPGLGLADLDAGDRAVVAGNDDQADLSKTAGLERFSWREAVGSARSVKILNPHGDVRLRFGGYRGELEVAAVLQQLRPDGTKLEVRVVGDDEVITVTVEPASKSGEPVAELLRDTTDRSRVDLAVMVPKALTVSARTERGMVECHGVKSDATLETTRGDIFVRKTSGCVNGRTEMGKIQVVLLPGVTESAQTFQSVTGDISVYVADTANLDVTLATSGEITTDYSVRIEHRDHEEPDKIAVARVGAGGRDLDLRSKRGSLKLRRLPVPSPAVTND